LGIWGSDHQAANAWLYARGIETYATLDNRIEFLIFVASRGVWERCGSEGQRGRSKGQGLLRPTMKRRRASPGDKGGWPGHGVIYIGIHQGIVERLVDGAGDLWEAMQDVWIRSEVLRRRGEGRWQRKRPRLLGTEYRVHWLWRILISIS